MLRTAIEIVKYWYGLVLSNFEMRTYVNRQMILLRSLLLISFFQLWTETWLAIYYTLIKRVLL